jgi:hypothetical protein
MPRASEVDLLPYYKPCGINYRTFLFSRFSGALLISMLFLEFAIGI